MKTIFDLSARDEILKRIETLSESNKSLWGKMTVSQMTRHCIIWDEWIQGKIESTGKQTFLGKIFGKMALRINTKDDRPLPKNMPSGKEFIVKETDGDLATQKTAWARLIMDYEQFSADSFIHDFFGKMTREQIGIFAYKHADHHLRQFGA